MGRGIRFITAVYDQKSESMGWPNSSFGFFRNVPHELSGQPSMFYLDYQQELVAMCTLNCSTSSFSF